MVTVDPGATGVQGSAPRGQGDDAGPTWSLIGPGTVGHCPRRWPAPKRADLPQHLRFAGGAIRHRADPQPAQLGRVTLPAATAQPQGSEHDVIATPENPHAQRPVQDVNGATAAASNTLVVVGEKRPVEVHYFWASRAGGFDLSHYNSARRGSRAVGPVRSLPQLVRQPLRYPRYLQYFCCGG